MARDQWDLLFHPHECGNLFSRLCCGCAVVCVCVCVCVVLAPAYVRGLFVGYATKGAIVLVVRVLVVGEEVLLLMCSGWSLQKGTPCWQDSWRCGSCVSMTLQGKGRKRGLRFHW